MSATAHLVCPICHKAHDLEVVSEEVAAALAEHPQVCEQCRPLRNRQNAEREREQDIAEAKRKAAEDLDSRIEESGIRTYELAFDPNHAGANVALSSWLIRNLDRSVWVFGPTGRCKTRTIQNAARMAVRDRSLRYWPAFDLAARLTETSKHPEAQLKDIYFADLLILEDLGVSNLTESRLTALTAIVDRRYTGWDQTRRMQGVESPTFGWSSYSRNRKLGGQIWITSQDSPEELVARLSAVNANNASALVRRLAEMCVVHEAEAVR
jgi:DNA replication protein DnaC